MKEIVTSTPITVGKGQLALQYFPNMTLECARRNLRGWIVDHPELHAALIAAGWSDRKSLLTPRQVQLIHHYLGEP